MKRVNYNPFVTARTRDRLSSPMNHLFKHDYLKGKILDFGTGYGTDVRILRQLRFDIAGYDRYNKKYDKAELLKQHYDMVTCHYVFNVIATWEAFNDTLEKIALLSDNLYISVRTDKKSIKDDWLYDEELRGYWTSKSFQRFYNLDDVYKDFGEVDIIKASNSYILFKI